MPLAAGADWKSDWKNIICVGEMMKLPKYFIETLQQASDCGINPFALKLLAESFADKPERFGNDNVILLAHAHNGQEVWFIMTKIKPEEKDFEAE